MTSKTEDHAAALIASLWGLAGETMNLGLGVVLFLSTFVAAVNSFAHAMGVGFIPEPTSFTPHLMAAVVWLLWREWYRAQGRAIAEEPPMNRLRIVIDEAAKRQVLEAMRAHDEGFGDRVRQVVADARARGRL